MFIENIELVIIIVISIVLILVFRKIYKPKQLSQTKNQNKKFEERKFVQKEYEEIVVDLISAKIKSEKWNEIEVENDSLENYFSRLSDTGGDESLKFIKKKINSVVIQIPYKKSFIDYEIKTGMETTKLKLFFEIQKKTKAQVDKINRRIKYIDLSFLK
ncbi:MAG: hypothetical protein V4548_03640 [Bacteroidota bacterium]